MLATNIRAYALARAFNFQALIRYNFVSVLCTRMYVCVCIYFYVFVCAFCAMSSLKNYCWQNVEQHASRHNEFIEIVSDIHIATYICIYI